MNTICVNGLLLAGYAFFVRSRTERLRGHVRIARDWLPLLLVMLAYHEMGFFAVRHAQHSLEVRWVVWDHIILRGGARTVIEFLGPVVPSILEMAYLSVYLLPPFSIAMLYLYGFPDRVDDFLSQFILGIFLCYGQFPFWPSEPPRTVFPTDDLPSYVTIFRRLNLWTLQTGGIHTSVFPSSHVAAAFGAAGAMWLCLPEYKWVSRSLAVIAGLIAVATVYGRYHYMADAVGGLLMACVAFLTAWLLKAPHGEILIRILRRSLWWRERA